MKPQDQSNQVPALTTTPKKRLSFKILCHLEFHPGARQGKKEIGCLGRGGGRLEHLEELPCQSLSFLSLDHL
jgi:hypothetical protein